MYIYIYIHIYIYISLAQQAAIPPPRKYIDIYHLYCRIPPNTYRTPSGRVLETIATSIQKHFRIDEQMSLEGWRRRNAIWGGSAASPGTHGPIYGLHSRSQNLKKTWKLQSNNYVKKEHPKTPTLMPNGYEKGRQKRCQNNSKNIAKTSIGK